jgi:hypothetical protein
MDLFFILDFLWWNFSLRRIPIYDDTLAFLQLLDSVDPTLAWVFPFRVLLIISIPLSMILFFKQSRYATAMMWIQAPFRLLLITPSLFVGVWLINQLQIGNVILNLSFLLVSEALKMYTVWRFRK